MLYSVGFAIVRNVVPIIDILDNGMDAEADLDLNLDLNEGAQSEDRDLRIHIRADLCFDGEVTGNEEWVNGSGGGW